ncbi:MAG TPA: hypothetical protein VFM63_04655 [Pyrinomonadaceae bacterium]|nr:hypothetical protein [Pyrinomonadaceae bacterium]
MSKAVQQSKENTLTTVSRLVEISALDTLFKDLYLQRARTLLSTIFSRGSHDAFKQNSAQIPWVEQQLRASVERSEWQRVTQLTERLRELKASVAAGSQSSKLGEAVYDDAADVEIDMFASGFNVFAGADNEALNARRNEAVNILTALQRLDAEKSAFYARRIADFKRLSFKAATAGKEEKDDRMDASQMQQAALSALDAGDLSKLEQMLANVAKLGEAKKPGAPEVEVTEVTELGEDLVYKWTEETLAAAAELGLTPVHTESRRHFAHLIPHGWQPSFRKQEVKQWTKDKISHLTFPSATTDKGREAIEFYLLNPFINSGGTRYSVCLVAEDLLLEDFPEPEGKDEVDSKLLDILGLNSRWGLSRSEIEQALVERGAEVLAKLKLDPEEFRVVAIPADLYTHLGPNRGWGQKEMWTHFDGYRVLEGGKLQALAGGDKRFGGTSDVVSFSPDYSSAKLFARFAVVQRKRMANWQK